MEITPTIERYLDGIIADEFHRYKSWDNCYQAFHVDKMTEIHTLELAFYLASWGMYRGSSGLLQKNHLIHKRAVEILFHEESLKLKCNQDNEVNKENINEILVLKGKLAAHYENIYFTKGNNIRKSISPTNTLISKVMLGTLSCIPAYDRYFIDGLKAMKMKHTTFDINSINELFGFIDSNTTDIKDAQNLIYTKTGNHYPLMKIMDMFFWQVGYDKELKEKSKKIKTNLLGL